MTGQRVSWELCAWACAMAWHGVGEVLATTSGLMPTAAARLARTTFNPDLVLTDGGARLVGGVWPLDEPAPGPVEGWAPYRTLFEFAASGRRHAMMGAAQIDKFGQSNIAAIGDYRQPRRQLAGARGAPTSTINHPVSFWISRHQPRVFVDRVDVVSGVGKPPELSGSGLLRYAALGRVVTDLAVLDLDAVTGRLRLCSVHPWSSPEEVQQMTGFDVGADAAYVVETAAPPKEAVRFLREQIDPKGLLAGEFARRSALRSGG